MASKNFFADDSWAIWINGDDTSTIYMNEWFDPQGSSYVDIGIQIMGLAETRDLNVYIPFSIETEEVEDISFALRDKSIFRAVFSATGIYEPLKNACTSELVYNGRTVDLVHLSTTNWCLCPLAEGTLLTVNVDDLRCCLDNEEAYLLFRIPHKSLNRIFHAKPTVRGLFRRLRDHVTSPIVTEKYGHAIRINEPRYLPGEITKIGAFHREKLYKAKITISVGEQYTINDSGCTRVHRLEEELYRNYAPHGFPCESSICYHWVQTRQDNLRGHFYFYFDIIRSYISKGSMLLYVILLILAGAAGSATWDLIKMLAKL